MTNLEDKTPGGASRRSFMRTGLGVAAIGAGVLTPGSRIFGQQQASSRSTLSSGDAAILRFLAAAELIESDLWIQYAELGGIGKAPPIEVDPNQSRTPYQVALSNLDSDGPQSLLSKLAGSVIVAC